MRFIYRIIDRWGKLKFKVLTTVSFFILCSFLKCFGIAMMWVGPESEGIADKIWNFITYIFLFLFEWEFIPSLFSKEIREFFSVGPFACTFMCACLFFEAVTWVYVGYLISRKLIVIAERRRKNMRECLIMREFMMLRINNIMFILYCLIILSKRDFIWFFMISLIFVLAFVFPGSIELLLHKPKYIRWARKSFPEYEPLRRIKFYKKALPKVLISSLILGILAIFTFIIKDELTLYLLLGKFFAFLSGMNLGISFSTKKILSDEE